MAMLRKRVWLVSLPVAAIGLALSAFACRGMIRDGVNRANYERIQVGMSRADVQAIMGGRPGVDLPWLGVEDIVFDERSRLSLHSPPKGQWWQADQHQLAVRYDASGHVVSKRYARHADIGAFQRFLDWLGI
jgi:hypothetical protein